MKEVIPANIDSLCFGSGWLSAPGESHIKQLPACPWLLPQPKSNPHRRLTLTLPTQAAFLPDPGCTVISRKPTAWSD